MIGKISNLILNAQMTPAVNSFLSVIGGALSSFFAIILQGVAWIGYCICRFALNIIDFMQFLVQKLAGLDSWMNLDKLDINNLKETDVVFRFLLSDSVINVFKNMFAIFLVLLCLFTIIAIIKNEYSNASTGGDQINHKKTLFGSVKAVLTVVIVPFVLIIGILASNAILASIVKAFNVNGNLSMGGQLFVASAYDASSYREYVDQDTRKATSNVVAFNYELNGEQITSVVNSAPAAINPMSYSSGNLFVGYMFTYDAKTYYLWETDTSNYKDYYYYIKYVLCAYIVESNPERSANLQQSFIKYNPNQANNNNIVNLVKSKFNSISSSMDYIVDNETAINLTSNYGLFKRNLHNSNDEIVTAAYNSWNYNTVITNGISSWASTDLSLISSNGTYVTNEGALVNARSFSNSYIWGMYHDGGISGFAPLAEEYLVMADVMDFMIQNGTELYFVNSCNQSIDWQNSGVEPRSLYTLTNGAGETESGLLVDYKDKGKVAYDIKNVQSELDGATYVICYYDSIANAYKPLANNVKYKTDNGNEYTFTSSQFNQDYKGAVVARGLFEKTTQANVVQPTYISSTMVGGVAGSDFDSRLKIATKLDLIGIKSNYLEKITDTQKDNSAIYSNVVNNTMYCDTNFVHYSNIDGVLSDDALKAVENFLLSNAINDVNNEDSTFTLFDDTQRPTVAELEQNIYRYVISFTRDSEASLSTHPIHYIVLTRILSYEVDAVSEPLYKNVYRLDIKTANNELFHLAESKGEITSINNISFGTNSDNNANLSYYSESDAFDYPTNKDALAYVITEQIKDARDSDNVITQTEAAEILKDADGVNDIGFTFKIIGHSSNVYTNLTYTVKVTLVDVLTVTTPANWGGTDTEQVYRLDYLVEIIPEERYKFNTKDIDTFACVEQNVVVKDNILNYYGNYLSLTTNLDESISNIVNGSSNGEYNFSPFAVCFKDTLTFDESIVSVKANSIKHTGTAFNDDSIGDLAITFTLIVKDTKSDAYYEAIVTLSLYRYHTTDIVSSEGIEPIIIYRFNMDYSVYNTYYMHSDNFEVNQTASADNQNTTFKNRIGVKTADGTFVPTVITLNSLDYVTTAFYSVDDKIVSLLQYKYRYSTEDGRICNVLFNAAQTNAKKCDNGIEFITASIINNNVVIDDIGSNANSYNESEMIYKLASLASIKTADYSFISTELLVNNSLTEAQKNDVKYSVYVLDVNNTINDNYYVYVAYISKTTNALMTINAESNTLVLSNYVYNVEGKNLVLATATGYDTGKIEAVAQEYVSERVQIDFYDVDKYGYNQYVSNNGIFTYTFTSSYNEIIIINSTTNSSLVVDKVNTVNNGAVSIIVGTETYSSLYTTSNNTTSLSYLQSQLNQPTTIVFCRDQMNTASIKFDIQIHVIDWVFRFRLGIATEQTSTPMQDNAVLSISKGYMALDYNFEGNVEIHNVYQVVNLQWIILVFGIALIISILGKAVWGLIKRIYEITLLFLIMPVVASTAPIDPKQSRFGDWQKQMVSQVLGAYGVTIGLNFFFIIMPVIRSASNIFTDADIVGLNSTIKIFANADRLNYLVYILFLLVALTLLRSVPALISSFVGGIDVVKQGEDTIAAVGATTKAAGDIASGRSAMGAVRNVTKTAKGMIPGSAIVASGKKVYEDFRKKHAKKDKNLEENKNITEQHASELENESRSMKNDAKAQLEALNTKKTDIENQLNDSSLTNDKKAALQAQLAQINAQKADIAIELNEATEKQRAADKLRNDLAAGNVYDYVGEEKKAKKEQSKYEKSRTGKAEADLNEVENEMFKYVDKLQKGKLARLPKLTAKQIAEYNKGKAKSQQIVDKSDAAYKTDEQKKRRMELQQTLHMKSLAEQIAKKQEIFYDAKNGIYRGLRGSFVRGVLSGRKTTEQKIKDQAAIDEIQQQRDNELGKLNETKKNFEDMKNSSLGVTEERLRKLFGDDAYNKTKAALMKENNGKAKVADIAEKLKGNLDSQYTKTETRFANKLAKADRELLDNKKGVMHFTGKLASSAVSNTGRFVKASAVNMAAFVKDSTEGVRNNVKLHAKTSLLYVKTGVKQSITKVKTKVTDTVDRITKARQDKTIAKLQEQANVNQQVIDEHTSGVTKKIAAAGAIEGIYKQNKSSTATWDAVKKHMANQNLNVDKSVYDKFNQLQKSSISVKDKTTEFKKFMNDYKTNLKNNPVKPRAVIEAEAKLQEITAEINKKKVEFSKTKAVKTDKPIKKRVKRVQMRSEVAETMKAKFDGILEETNKKFNEAKNKTNLGMVESAINLNERAQAEIEKRLAKYLERNLAKLKISDKKDLFATKQLTPAQEATKRRLEETLKALEKSKRGEKLSEQENHLIRKQLNKIATSKIKQENVQKQTAKLGDKINEKAITDAYNKELLRVSKMAIPQPEVKALIEKARLEGKYNSARLRQELNNIYKAKLARFNSSGSNRTQINRELNELKEMISILQSTDVKYKRSIKNLTESNKKLTKQVKNQKSKSALDQQTNVKNSFGDNASGA